MLAPRYGEKHNSNIFSCNRIHQNQMHKTSASTTENKKNYKLIINNDTTPVSYNRQTTNLVSGP